MNWLQIVILSASIATVVQCVPLSNNTLEEPLQANKTSNVTHPSTPDNDRQSRDIPYQKSAVTQYANRRQAGLATLAPLLIPLAGSVLGPLVTSGGTGLLGLFSNFFRRNRTSLSYDAYMVNVPGVAGPHLYLLPHSKDDFPASVSGEETPYLVTPLNGGERPFQDTYKLHSPGYIRRQQQHPSESFEEEDRHSLSFVRESNET